MLRTVRTASCLLAMLFTTMTVWASSIPCPSILPTPRGETFSPELATIDSLDKAEIWIRGRLGPNPTQAELADEITLFAQRRFYHGLSSVTPCDNWLISLAGRFSATLAAPVRPDDILKYGSAICSQQAIVLQALFQRFGLEYATLGIDMPPHMMAAARIDGVWAAYDSDLEPNREGLVPVASLNDGHVWKRLYAGKPGLAGYGPGDLGDQWSRAAAKGKVELKWINQNPAPRGRLLHWTTEFMSHHGWQIFLLLFLLTSPGMHWPARQARLPARYLPQRPLRVRAAALGLAAPVDRTAALH